MTTRHTADTINDDDLDQLYADLDRYEEVLAEMNEQAINLTRRAARAEAALTRVRALRDQWLLMTLEPGQVRRLLDQLTHAIDGEQAAAEATRPASWLLAGTRDLSIPDQP
jgi:hypothetical protein